MILNGSQFEAVLFSSMAFFALSILGFNYSLRRCWYPGAPYRSWLLGTNITDISRMLRLCLNILRNTEMPSVRPWLIVLLVATMFFTLLFIALVTGLLAAQG